MSDSDPDPNKKNDKWGPDSDTNVLPHITN